MLIYTTFTHKAINWTEVVHFLISLLVVDFGSYETETTKHMSVPLKEVVVRPLLIKTNLDPKDLGNFRPVSNLSFLGKVIEQVVVKQLPTVSR